MKQLRVSDVKFHSGIVLVYYKYSKTNQNSSRVSWVPIYPVYDSRFNLEKHLKALISSAKAKSDAPLFSFNSKDFHSRATLVRSLDKCIFEAGLPVADYSWHSFRRGAAVLAYELGMSDSSVQVLGDWASSAFKAYLEFAFERKLAVANKMSKKFNYFVKDT